MLSIINRKSNCTKISLALEESSLLKEWAYYSGISFKESNGIFVNQYICLKLVKKTAGILSCSQGENNTHFFIVMFTLYKAWDPLDVEVYRV